MLALPDRPNPQALADAAGFWRLEFFFIRRFNGVRARRLQRHSVLIAARGRKPSCGGKTRLTSESRADAVLGRPAPELEGRWHPRGLVEVGADEHHK